MEYQYATRENFLALCERIKEKNCPPFKWPDINPNVIFDELVARYSEPHRAYHTLRHIEHGLAELESARSCPFQPVPDLEAIELALWYHDAVYDPGANNNESQSRLLLLEHFVPNIDHYNPIFEDIAALIFVTNHAVSPFDDEGQIRVHQTAQIIIDIDLAIFGQPEDVFKEYERGIRQEYGHLSDRDFYAGRVALLYSFLHRPTFYLTDFFQQKYEEQARRNLWSSFANAIINIGPFPSAP